MHQSIQHVAALGSVLLLFFGGLLVELLSQATNDRGLRAHMRQPPARKLQDRTLDGTIQAFQAAKARFHKKLQNDYGSENFDSIFFDMDPDTKEKVSRGRNFLNPTSEPNGPARSRMVRKMQMKLLNVLVEGKEETFKWISGGHSSAAGHGNLYNESYSAYLEQNGQDIFNSVGMKLEASNFAMGGTSSGHEIGSCMEAVFGTDMDVLSWDYGMTDGKAWDKVERFCYRAARFPNRPACVIHSGNGNGANHPRVATGAKVEAAGGTTLFVNYDVLSEATKAMPDTAEVGGKDAIDTMPKYVRSMRCGNLIERGDPTCNLEKYTTTGDSVCDNRKYKANWHPGWKWHALVANLKVLSLMEYMDDALKEIKKSNADQALLLSQLTKAQEGDYKNLTNSPQFNTQYYQPPAFCHTARLPAVTRHEGYLTESKEKGFDNYDEGIESQDAKAMNLEDGKSMPLVFEGGGRQKCKIPLNKDYKDYFITWGTYSGFSTLTVPNAAEKAAYLTKGQSFNGTIAICWRGCDWGKCPKNSIRLEQFNEGKAIVQVNGVKVKKMVEFGRDCAFLEGPQGRDSWKADANGQYVLGISVPDPDSFMRWSSVIVW